MKKIYQNNPLVSIIMNCHNGENFLELKHNLVNKNLLMLPNNILRCVFFYFSNIFGRVVQW